MRQSTYRNETQVYNRSLADANACGQRQSALIGVLRLLTANQASGKLPDIHLLGEDSEAATLVLRCGMRFVFKSSALEQLYTARKDAHLYPPEVVKGFFRVMAIIRSARDERDFRALRSLNYEALQGQRRHQNSLRLNQQWRLIVERHEDEDGRLLWVIDIEDYH